MENKFGHIMRLSYSLAKAHFKVRNEASYLGILWYLLSPLSYFLIILYLRGTLSLDNGVRLYPAYLLIGLIMMNFFCQAVAGSVDVIRSNSGFIKSMKVFYEVFVISIVMRGIFSHLFELILVAFLFVYLHIPLLGIISYLLVFLFFTIFTLGICFLAATVGLYFNDLKNVWVIVSQLLLFATPVFYAAKADTYLYSLNLFNPLSGFLALARDVSIYRAFPPLWPIIFLILLSACVFTIGFSAFNRFKRHFAELI